MCCTAYYGTTVLCSAVLCHGVLRGEMAVLRYETDLLCCVM